MIKAVLSSFSVLRSRNVSIYIAGQAVSLIGTWLQITAQSWVVWTLTGSTVDLGITGMLSSLPLLFLGPWAGSWADRYNRRKLLIGTQISAMLLAFVLAFLVLSGQVQIWHVYILALLLGIVNSIDMPTQQAFLSDLAGTDEVRKAVNVNVMLVQLSRLLGPGLAGLVIASFGAGTTFLLNGISFIAVVISLMLVHRAKLASARGVNNNALRGFSQALRFIAPQALLVNLVLFIMLIMCLGVPTIINILPAVTTDVLHGDASLLGLLVSASGAGSLIGAIIIGPWFQTMRRTELVLSFAMIGGALSIILLGASTLPVLSMFALFLAGLCLPPVFVTSMGLLQYSTPPEMRARVTGLAMMLSFGLQPIAALWIGWIAEPQLLGLQRAVILDAALLLGGGLLMLYRSQRASARLANASMPPAESLDIDGMM